MEVQGGIDNKAVVCVCEVIGTAFLLIAVNWGGTQGYTPQSVGFTVFMCIQLFGSISGGHFNPAVTAGMYFKECGFNLNDPTWK
jgi:glycerol uptake facilitator-like aquaporin